MISDEIDIDIDLPAAEDYPADCARGLRKYLFVMAVIVVGTLTGMFFYRQQASAIQPMVIAAMPMNGAPMVQMPPTGLQMAATNAVALANVAPAAILAAVPGAMPDFATVVASLHGSVVSVGRSRPDGRFGFNRAALPGGGEAGQPQANAAQPVAPAAGAEAAFQFATPVAGAVLESIGTGFIVRNDGYILTNYHVVRGNDAMVVTVFDEAGAQRYPANIVKLDASVDLALLKIEARGPLAVAPLGDSDQIAVADEVIAIGSPFGLDLTVSRGIISAKRKSLVIEGTVHRDLLQTDAAINQGNSGGPLVNRAGEVVGINTAIYTPTGAFAGVGFAVPSNQAKQFLAEELMLQSAVGAPGRGLWGLTVAAPPGTVSTAAGLAAPSIMSGVASPHRDGRETMDCAICHQVISRPGAAAARGIPAAAPVMAAPPIVAGTPAPHRDGRETMDCAICHKFVPRGAAAAMAPVAQGAVAGGGLQFARAPATLALNVALPAPVPSASVGGFVILGASTMPITATLAQQIGQPEGRGVFVGSVVTGSPAAVAGLQPGMIIEKVDGRRLRSPRELFAAVSGAKTGDSLRLAVTSDKVRQELRLVVSVLPAAVANGAGVPAAPVPTEFNWRGMEIETFAPVTGPGGVAGVPPVKGAVIAEVIPGSPAFRAGAQANDIILAINGQPTGTAALMNQAVQAAIGKRDVMMKLARKNQVLLVVLP